MMGKVKESLTKLGHSIDTGVSSLMTDMGSRIRVHCPSCNGEILSPPNQFVECPKCQHQFHSPSIAARTSQIASDVSKDTKKAYREVTAEGKRGA